MTELKPCPFCGHTANLCRNGSRTGFYVYVKCDICEAHGKAYMMDTDPIDAGWDTEECTSAVRAWNLRTVLAGADRGKP